MKIRESLVMQNKQIATAIKIVSLILLSVVAIFTTIYLTNSETNKSILKKVKKDINDHRIGYSKLYEYLEDSTSDKYPVSKIVYRNGLGYVMFFLKDTLNNEHSFQKEVPLFMDDLNLSFGAAYNRSHRTIYIDLPWINSDFFKTKIIYSKMQDKVIKIYLSKGYQLCDTISGVSDNKNSILKIDTSWLLAFYKK